MKREGIFLFLPPGGQKKRNTDRGSGGTEECMQLTGAEIIVECLKEQGVDTVFGYPGGTILNVYDALYKHQREIFHVLTSHEQGAATRLTAMQELRERWVSAWLPAAPVPQILLQGLPLPIWIPFPWWRLRRM